MSTITKQLNAYVSGNINLTTGRVTYLLKHLVRFYTITMDFPIIDVKLLRATKFDHLNCKPCFDEVSRLSYIPKSSNIIPSLGRLNKVVVVTLKW